MMQPPNLALYPLARPVYRPREPQGLADALARFERAASDYERGDWPAAADGFLAAAGDLHGCAPAETGVRTLAYWNALVVRAALGDADGADRVVRLVGLDDPECGPAVADLARSLFGG